MLNWRRDPGYEQRMLQYEQRMLQYEQRRMQHELRMKQLESEIEQLDRDIQQLDRDNAKLESLLSCVDQLCFPPVSSSNPPPSIESNCGSSWS
jgi:hypothetical protein